MISEHMARFDVEDKPDFQTQYKAHMAKLGAKGGKVGGQRRMATMTQEQRSEIALKAARARWAKAAKKR